MTLKLYPKNLEYDVRKNKFIPRVINNKERLKQYHRYYIEEYGTIKVTNIEYIGGIEYYFINYINGNACISYPVMSVNKVYELLHNKSSIEEQDIVNSNKSYSGAEIKYWFSMHNEELDNKYKGFISFINPKSNNTLIDNKYYHVTYNKKNRQKCQISLDKSKSH